MHANQQIEQQRGKASYRPQHCFPAEDQSMNRYLSCPTHNIKSQPQHSADCQATPMGPKNLAPMTLATRFVNPSASAAAMP